MGNAKNEGGGMSAVDVVVLVISCAVILLTVSTMLF